MVLAVANPTHGAIQQRVMSADPHGNRTDPRRRTRSSLTSTIQKIIHAVI
jgi:hypothetical protein